MHARRLEDSIRELCSRALEAQDSELDSIFSALQNALREHNERLRKLAAAKLAAWRPRGAAGKGERGARNQCDKGAAIRPAILLGQTLFGHKPASPAVQIRRIVAAA